MDQVPNAQSYPNTYPFQASNLGQQLIAKGKTFNPYHLTERDRAAPSIAPVFQYRQFGRAEMRADCPNAVAGYASLNVCAQLKSDTAPTAAALAAPPAPHIERITKTYLAPLPGHPDSGKRITRRFATVGEMRAYGDERRAAALAYIRAKKSEQ